MSEEVTRQELIHIGSKMGQELQDYIDDAEESGSEAGATKALVEEWEVIYRRSAFVWEKLVATEHETTLLDDL